MKDEIIERIYAHLLTQGLTDLGADYLAECSGVSKRTFYKYIGSLDELFDVLLKKIMARLSEHFDEHRNRKDGSLLEIIRGTFQTLPRVIPLPVRDFILRLHKVRPDLVNKLFLFRRKQLKSVETMLIQAQVKRQVRNDIHPKVATDALIAMVDTMLVPEYIMQSGENFDNVFNTIFDLFFNGVTPRPS